MSMREKVEQAKTELTQAGDEIEALTQIDMNPEEPFYDDLEVIGVEQLRKFPPLEAGHPVLLELCAACREQFREGNLVTLISIGPGEDPDERMKAREGRAYTAVALPTHWACATGEED